MCDVMNQLPENLREPLAELLLSVADDKLFLGHRNADWTGLAPILEEDIAFSSLSQDELAHAQALYQIVAPLRQTTADALAFGRKPEEYRCAQIVETSDDFNWAIALCRNFYCDHFDAIRLTRLAASSYGPLAELAGRLMAEERIHIDHDDSWIKRLGRGGSDSKGRIQEALDKLALSATMLWEPTAGQDMLEAQGLYPLTVSSPFNQWAKALQRVADDAGLKLESHSPAVGVRGGRHGLRTSGFAAMLEEMTEVYRLEPGAAW
jgi:ring-1,2-phenylacetyl-CoA epoxidase subunit PaaC